MSGRSEKELDSSTHELHSRVLFESSKMRMEYEVAGEVITLRPVGILDEDSNLGLVITAALAIYPKPSEVRIDLGSVSRINSCGVREWISFITRFRSLFSVSFVNVSELMVEQASMINGIFGGAGFRVVSIQVPYYCAKCDARTLSLVELSKLKLVDRVPVVPVEHCRSCKAELEFDSAPEQYFGFLIG